MNTQFKIHALQTIRLLLIMSQIVISYVIFSVHFCVAPIVGEKYLVALACAEIASWFIYMEFALQKSRALKRRINIYKSTHHDGNA